MARAVEKIAVVGAGAMGRGIAQVAAQGGLDVSIYDAAAGAAEKARAAIVDQLNAMAEKGKITADEARAAAGRLAVANDLAALAGTDAAIEAVIEDLGVKRALFARLEDILPADALLASNTSSIRIANIAAGCRHRGRVGGLHFFNPVPVMKLVEVIAAPDTTPDTVDALTALGKRLGRVPVTVKDGPGFLVNLGGRAYTTEGLRILHDGAATPAQVDAVMRDACGFKLGPFQLLDLTGLDVNFPVSMIVYEGFMHDRRLATTPLHQAMREGGRLGRKTGQGFYAYDDKGRKLSGQDDDADAAADASPAAAVFIALDHRDRLRELLSAAGAQALAADDGRSPIVVAPLGEDASAVAARLGLDPARTVAIDPTAINPTRLTVMTPPGADPAIRAAVAARLAATGAKVTAIADSPGFIAQRIRAMIANLGCEMAQTGIAAPADIDRAMTLGLNYPQGPLAMAERVGLPETLTILRNLQALTGDDRYRPSPWLRRRAELGLSITTADR